MAGSVGGSEGEGPGSSGRRTPSRRHTDEDAAGEYLRDILLAECDGHGCRGSYDESDIADIKTHTLSLDAFARAHRSHSEAQSDVHDWLLFRKAFGVRTITERRLSGDCIDAGYFTSHASNKEGHPVAAVDLKWCHATDERMAGSVKPYIVQCFERWYRDGAPITLLVSSLTCTSQAVHLGLLAWVARVGLRFYPGLIGDIVLLQDDEGDAPQGSGLAEIEAAIRNVDLPEHKTRITLAHVQTLDRHIPGGLAAIKLQAQGNGEFGRDFKKVTFDGRQKVGTLQPRSELLFTQQDTGEFVSELNITNDIINTPITFKIKTIAPERYRVQPATGIVNVDCKLRVVIGCRRAPDAAAPDRFLVLLAPVPPGTHPTLLAKADQLWKSVDRTKASEYRLQCRFEDKDKEVIPHLRDIKEQLEQVRRSTAAIESRVMSAAPVPAGRPWRLVLLCLLVGFCLGIVCDRVAQQLERGTLHLPDLRPLLRLDLAAGRLMLSRAWRGPFPGPQSQPTHPS